jgi:membrane protein required for colicin V production
MNWLDWLIIGLVAASVIGGFKEGFIRMGVGFAALIVGFIAASWFHGFLATPLMPYLHSRATASIAAYILIFLGVMLAGTLIAAIIVRVFKLIGLSFVDRLLGGMFGFVRAGIVLAVATMVIMAFAPKRMPAAVNQSELAPYVMGASEILAAATPFEIKQGFHRSYDEFREMIQELAAKKMKQLPVREE